MNWIISDRRKKKLKLELWNHSIVVRLVTPSPEGKKSIHKFLCEEKTIETFKFYFDVYDLLWLKQCLGESIRELRIRYKKHRNKRNHNYPDRLVVERAGSTRFAKIYFMRDYRATTFYCGLKSLVRFRRKVSDAIIDIVLAKK